MSEAAAKWIVNKGKFYGVGVDVASVDPGTLVAAHLVLLGKNLYVIENVKLTEKVPGKFQEFISILVYTNFPKHISYRHISSLLLSFNFSLSIR